MNKNYFLILLVALAFFTTQHGVGQNNANGNVMEQNIDGLSIYPNPVTNGKVFVYISSKDNLTKKIAVFDVLGKQLYTTVLTGKELNISNLGKGVYILKVTENNVSETRKLVVK